MADQKSKLSEAERAMHGVLAEAHCLLQLYPSLEDESPWSTLAHSVLHRLADALDVMEAARRVEVQA
ncbi:hypothetical protein [Paracidovorax citrulli]|uniref:hypothetical protein n=1 Tax=Paracidovorax citrulli TaxID=80869 RepID=UPI00110F7D64|nr:hypothetical protein [Paracidovorax citrulli]UEG48083.1 hypothetical protein LKW27_09620 [Paracidovorax citrulli]UMT96655.1 hypothetical protein FRC97_17555 [Paracidovorax citrulli]